MRGEGMSTHPNALLILCLTPDNLARKTYRAIAEENGIDEEDPVIEIGEAQYHCGIHDEGGYDKHWQVNLPEGSIFLLDLFTYGYGDKKEWTELEKQKQELETWGRAVCEKHHCSMNIYVSANYW